MGFIFGLIGNIIMGGIVGAGGRAILPGAQDMSLGKTVGLGVVANLAAGILMAVLGFGGAGFIMSLIIGSLVAAGLLYLAIQKGWMRVNS